MPSAQPARRARKPAGRYHHGDLQRAMRQTAVQMIQAAGVEALTLRDVGARLGVSRTALYRHYENKRALLAAVAAEGFVLLRRDLESASTAAGGDGALRPAFAAMGQAYVRFAMTHPSHYRVMFGGFLQPSDVGAQLEGESTDAFGLLLASIAAQQQAGFVRPDDDARQLAQFVWAEAHGIAMLALAGLLPHPDAALEMMTYANARLYSGIGV